MNEWADLRREIQSEIATEMVREEWEDRRRKGEQMKNNEIANRTESVNLANPKDIMEFATNLKNLIVQNKLFTNIKGKNYVNVKAPAICQPSTFT